MHWSGFTIYPYICLLCNKFYSLNFNFKLFFHLFWPLLSFKQIFILFLFCQKLNNPWNLFYSYKRDYRLDQCQSCQLFLTMAPFSHGLLQVTLSVTVKVSYHSPYQWKLALSLSVNLLGLKLILVILFFFTCKYNYQILNLILSLY